MHPDPSHPAFDATVLVTTKNRRDDLRRALLSVAAQTGAAVEILVIDDGSTDGTEEMVQAEFPQVRLVRHEQSRGLIVRRNEGARLASATVLFSMDDDAEFSTPHTVAQTLAEFDGPRIGAVAIPFIDVLKGPDVVQPLPDGARVTAFAIDAYVGTSHALRVDLFLSLGGYREELIHQGEERDYCLRLLNLGYVVRAGAADPIHHHESPHRSFARMDFYGRRNDVLFAWQNVPWPYLPIHLAGTILNGLRFAATGAHHPGRMLAGLLVGISQCRRSARARCPVAKGAYVLNRSLRKIGPRPLEAIQAGLPSGTLSVERPSN